MFKKIIYKLLLCLIYFHTSNGQVYAPDTTFNQVIIPENGAKINFLHKIDDKSYFIGTNIYGDANKPFINNLYRVDTNGLLTESIKNFNSTLVEANAGKILFTNTNGTFLYENRKIKIVDKRIAFDVNWKTNEILIDDKGEIKIIDFEGNERYYIKKIPLNGGYYGIYRTIFFDNKNIATYDQNKLILFDFNGIQLTFPIEYQLPYITSLGYKELFKINDNFLGLNLFDPYFQYYRTVTLVLDSTGKIVQNNADKFYAKFIGNQQNQLIQRKQSCINCSSVYTFYDENLKEIKNKTLFGENYIKIIAFEDYFLATDYLKLIKLSTKNSKYIEATLPDTVEINEKPIKISTKTIGSSEKVNISCDCDLLSNDTLYPKKAGNFRIAFKTNSGLVLYKSITVKKRIDSIYYTGPTEIFLSELPLKLNIYTKSGLQIKKSSGNSFFFNLSDTQIINRNLPIYFKNEVLEIYLETSKNEVYEQSKRVLKIKISGLMPIIDFENKLNNFIAYPNPINGDNLKILYTGDERISNPEFKLFDNVGREIDLSQINNGNDYIYQLNIPPNQPKGIYYLRIVFFTFKYGNRQEFKRIAIE